MEAGIITVDGLKVGVIEVTLSEEVPFEPDFQGYVPMGRADSPPAASTGGIGGEGGGKPTPGRHGPSQGHGRPSHGAVESHHDHEMAPRKDRAPTPEGREYSGQGGQAYRQGTAETDAAIVRAAREHDLDPNFMRSVAGIESSMDPSSNANKSTQYKGLYQIGRDEWRRTGRGGNIYSAEDNAQAAARLFKENSRQFESHFGRKPTDTELYLMHQQGLGFYTRGAMTNIQGNLPASERGKPQTHESFEAAWGRRVAQGKAAAARAHGTPVADTPTPMPTQTEPM